MKRKLLLLGAVLLLGAQSFGATVKLWHAWSGKEKEALFGVVAKYEQLSGNKVELLGVPHDALQGKFSTMGPQGQGPDIIITPGDWIGPFVQQGLLEPVDEYLTENTKEGFMPNVLDTCKYDGKLYGLPESFECVALIYNKDLVPEPPKTTDEMIKIGLEITNEEESMYGMIYDKGNYFYHIPWIGGFGGTLLDENNNPTFDTKAQIDSADFVYSLSQGDTMIMPEEADYNVMMTLFTDGLVGMIMVGPWAIGDLIESEVNFGVTKLPMVSQTGKYPAPTLGPKAVLMSSNSQNKKEAYGLMEFLTSEDTQIELAKVGHLSSRDSVYDSRQVMKSKTYEYVKGFKEQADKGVAMPTAPEMAAGVWSNGMTFLSQVLSGSASAEKAGKEAQEKAVEAINDMRK